jgi:hypothetical protein
MSGWMDHRQLSHNEFPMGGALVSADQWCNTKRLSQDNSKLPQRDFFGGWHLIVVLFLQIEITISFHMNQKLSRAYDIHSFVEVPFWSNFFVSNMFLSLLLKRGVLSILFRFQIELGFLTIACCVSWPMLPKYLNIS